MRYKYFKSRVSGRYCRDCLNQLYKLQIQRKDCWYNPYPATCKSCNQVRNIVGDLTISGRWKLLIHSH